MIRRAFVRALSGAILTTLLGVKAWRLEAGEEELDRDWEFVAIDEPAPDGCADFYTDRRCPRAYLVAPAHFEYTEIDYPNGTSVFGMIGR